MGLLLEGLEDIVGRSLEVDPEMLFARFDADCDGSLDPDEVKCASPAGGWVGWLAGWLAGWVARCLFVCLCGGGRVFVCACCG